MKTIAKKEKVFALAGIDPDWKYKRLTIPEDYKPHWRYPYWLTGEGIPVIVDPYRSMVFWPGQYPEPTDITSPRVEEDDDTFWENWKITRLSGEKPYIRNEYTRSTWNYNVLYETGVYEVKDIKWGDSYHIQLLCWDVEYEFQTFLRTDLKVRSLLGSDIMRLEDDFYRNIFSRNGESYKVAHLDR